MIIYLISFCFITGIHGCGYVNNDCLVRPKGCNDDLDEVCCTVSWEVVCCCKDTISTNAVTESFNISFSYFSTTDKTDSTPVSVTPKETHDVQVRFEQFSSGRNVNLTLNVSLSGGNVRILHAASDNTTSLRMHLDARSVFVVSVLVLLAIVCIGTITCVLICYSDRIRRFLVRRARIYLRERYSPPPSEFAL